MYLRVLGFFLTIIYGDDKMISKQQKNLAFWEKYRRYLKSPQWHKKRLALAFKVNFTCERCGQYNRSSFEAHHKTYKNVFKEPLSDLMFLCGDCHKIIEINKRIKRNKK